VSTRSTIPLIWGTNYIDDYADPAAGADKVIATPNNARARLLVLSFTLTTDANAANRHVHIQHYDGAKTIELGAAGAFVTASSVCNFTAAPALSNNVTYVGTFQSFGIADIANFYEGHELHIHVINIQVGDQISACIAEWSNYIYKQ